MKPLIFLLGILLTLNFISASTCPSGIYPCDSNLPFVVSTPSTSISSSVNYSTVNVNNSDYLDNIDSTGFCRMDYNNNGNIGIGDNLKLTMGASGETDYYQTFDGTNTQFYTSGNFNFKNGNMGLGADAVSTNRLRIYANDSVTATSPLKIEQAGDGDSSIEFLITGSRAYKIGIDNSDSDKFKISEGTDGLETDNLMTITRTGEVGIGTSSPNTPLQINQRADNLGLSIYGYDDKVTSNFLTSIDGAGNTYSTSTGSLYLASGNHMTCRAGSGGNIYYDTGEAIIWRDKDDSYAIRLTLESSTGNLIQGGDNQKIYFGLSKDASIYYNGADMIFNSREVGTGDFIFKGGDVGIGTASPTQKLEVNGSALINGNVSANYFIGDGSLLTGISGGSSSDADFNYLNEYTFFEPFLINNAIETGEVGKMGWNYVTQGGAVTGRVMSQGNRPGQIRLSTGTSATSNTTLDLGLNWNFDSYTGNITYEWAFNLSNNSTDAQNFTIIMGFADNLGTTVFPVDGVFFIHNSTTLNWTAVTSSNNARTFNNTNVPIIEGTWQKFKIELINQSNHNTKYYINDILVSQIGTNIPNGVARAMGPVFTIRKYGGTTARTLDLDYVYYKQKFQVSR